MHPGRVLDQLERIGCANNWTAKKVHAMKNELVRLKVWCEERDLWEDGKLTCLVTSEYLQARNDEAISKHAISAGQRDGATVWKGARTVLRTLEIHLGLDLGTVGANINQHPDVRRPTKKALAPSFWMLIMIEMFMLSLHTSEVMANIAGGFLFTAYACMRGEQSGNCSFGFEAPLSRNRRFKGEQMLHGMVFREKSPKNSSAVPRPFWMCVRGIRGDRRWFDRLLSTLGGMDGQRRVKCVYRDFDAPNNSHDPSKATKPLLCPLLGVKLLRGVQCMIKEACNFSLGEQLRITVHSSRHFMPYCCASSKEPATRAVECGRWSSSTAQMHDLIPSELRQAQEAEKVGNLPGEYSAPLKVKRVGEILSLQLFRVRDVVNSGDWTHLPKIDDGFDLLVLYNETTDGV